MHRAAAAVTGLVVASCAASPAAAAPSWIAAWGASPTGSATGGPANATVRDLVRVSLGGTKIRLRIANALSTDTPLVIGAATVAPAKAPGDASLVPGTLRTVTFDGGRRTVTVPP